MDGPCANVNLNARRDSEFLRGVISEAPARHAPGPLLFAAIRHALFFCLDCSPTNEKMSHVDAQTAAIARADFWEN